MIITRTPYRISFFGGGSDYPEWFTEHDGAVLGATINKYCWISVRPRSQFGPRYKVIYSQVEECDSIDQIKHPAVRACLRDLEIDGCEIYHTSDLPARSGIGSSSAFVVGLFRALYMMKHSELSWHVGQEFIARAAIVIEREDLKETVGWQDQFLCSMGGFNKLTFKKSGQVEVFNYGSMIPQREGESWPHVQRYHTVTGLQKNLMLFYTGIQRTSSDITGTYAPSLTKQFERMSRIQEMPELAVKMMDAGNVNGIGYMLDEAWQLKRNLSPSISTPEIDSIYSSALNAGAIGGKLLGGGGGGFFLLYVLPNKQPNVRDALRDLKEVPFKFESEGSRVIHYEKV